jgi:hypothetical protein
VRLIGRTDGATALAALAAAWPRSAAAREVRRLRRDGYAVGAPCEIDFLVSLDEPATDAVLSAMRAAGFTLVHHAGAAPCFASVRASVRLRALHLARAESRLNRAVRPHGGFAVVVGPAEPAAHSSLATCGAPSCRAAPRRRPSRAACRADASRRARRSAQPS